MTADFPIGKVSARTSWNPHESVENRLHTMAEFAGNLLVAQSGGPTAVVNASVAGVIQQAGRYPEQVEEIYGGLNGILGVLNEDLIDLQEEKRTAIEGLKHTPAAALGTCRYKIDFKKKPELAARDMERLFQVFQAHNIRFFLYVGGNDSQDTAHKIHQQAIARAYQMRVMGVRYYMAQSDEAMMKILGPELFQVWKARRSKPAE